MSPLQKLWFQAFQACLAGVFLALLFQVTAQGLSHPEGYPPEESHNSAAVGEGDFGLPTNTFDSLYANGLVMALTDLRLDPVGSPIQTAQVHLSNGPLKGALITIENTLTGETGYDIPLEPGSRVLVEMEPKAIEPTTAPIPTTGQPKPNPASGQPYRTADWNFYVIDFERFSILIALFSVWSLLMLWLGGRWGLVGFLILTTGLWCLQEWIVPWGITLPVVLAQGGFLAMLALTLWPDGARYLPPALQRTDHASGNTQSIPITPFLWRAPKVATVLSLQGILLYLLMTLGSIDGYLGEWMRHSASEWGAITPASLFYWGGSLAVVALANGVFTQPYENLNQLKQTAVGQSLMVLTLLGGLFLGLVWLQFDEPLAKLLNLEYTVTPMVYGLWLALTPLWCIGIHQTTEPLE